MKGELSTMINCFVVSRIGSDGSKERMQADQVYKYIISPVCRRCGFKPIRVDCLNQSDLITQTIFDNLKNADLVIADITGQNPNVFLEIGYRLYTKKPMILLREKNQNIPFDIANIRVFEYDLTDLDSVDQVKRRLEQAIRSFNCFKEEKTQQRRSLKRKVETRITNRGP